MTTCDIGDRTCGTGEWTGPQPGDPDNSLSISAAPSFGGIDVTWSYPGVNPHAVAHVQLYRSATNVFDSAVQIALVAGSRFHDPIDEVATYYYWVRVVSIHGTLGDPVGPASATSGLLVGDMIERLTGQIDAGVLAESLKGRLDEISSLNENLAAEIFDRESGQTSFAEALADVQAGVAEAHTFIANEIASRVDEQGAIIEQINMVAATAADQVAQVLVTTQAWVDTVDNKAGALWSARLTVNNLVGGFGIYNDGSTVEAGFDVDTFWVGRTNADKRKPFIISGGVTYIDKAAIRDADIDTLKIAGNAVTVPVTSNSYRQIHGAGADNWQVIADGYIYMSHPGVLYTHCVVVQNFIDGLRTWRMRMQIDSEFGVAVGGDDVSTSPVISMSRAVSAGWHRCAVTWWGVDSAVLINATELFLMGAKR